MRLTTGTRTRRAARAWAAAQRAGAPVTPPRRLVASLTAAATAVLASAALLIFAEPAYAYPVSNIYVCDAYCYSYTSATVTWYNRTAGINGYAVDTEENNTGIVTIVAFEAYAGATKIDSKVITANDVPDDVVNPTYYDVAIGDSNLVGGFDRLKVTVCCDNGAVRWNCAYKNYSRP